MANAVLLLFLSAYNKSTNLIKYMHEDKTYCGLQTNDAAVDCLCDSAGNEDSITKVICLCSQMVYSEKHETEEGTKTQFERFKDRISKKIPGADVVPIYYDFEIKDDGEISEIEEDEDRSKSIYLQVSEELKDLKDYNVYMDCTGGLRDTSFLLVSIIRYMEYVGIHLKKIIYAEWKKGTTEGKIHNINHIYKVFRLIEGVNLFVKYGRSDSLNEVFQELPKDTSMAARNLINSMKAFSDSLVLSDISRIDELVSNIEQSINDLDNTYKLDLYSQMLKTLCPLIKEKMHIGENKPSIVSIARWCVENDLIQQALTIYVEKIPEYLLKNKKYIFPNYICNNLIGYTAEEFYREIYDGLLEGKYSYEFKVILNNARVLGSNNKKTDVDETIKKLDEVKDNYKGKYLKAITELISIYNERQRIGGKDYDKYISATVSREDAAGISNRCFLLNGYPLSLNKGTYWRKKKALKKTEGDERLFSVLSNYLLVKINRNRIIHVSDEVRDDSEEGALEYLKENGLNTGTTLKDVKAMLCKALQVVEEA